MRAASSVQDLLGDPIGSYLRGRSFVVWFHERLAGAFGFGRLHPADHELLASLLVSPVLPPGYDMLCDLSCVEVFDDRAYELFADVLESRRDLLANLRRLAIVRPPRLPGVAVAGMFHDRIDRIVDAQLFARHTEALSWLGYADTSREQSEIDQLIASVHVESPLLRKLRDYLADNLVGASLARAARDLGASTRSLQRTLATAGTSFRDELGLARVRAAELLLNTTDDKLEAIATQLGLASAPTFMALFRRVVGETPDTFRRRRRGAR